MDSKTKKKVTSGGLITAFGVFIAISTKLNGMWGLWDHLGGFITKPWFLTWGYPIIAFVLLAFLAVAAFSFHSKYQTSLRERPITIALFLPLENAGADARKDGESQLSGVIKFLKKESELTQRVHLKIFDHSLPKVEAANLSTEERKSERIKKIERLLEDEYNKGTRYFYCTMSQVCERLVPKFIEWAQTKSGDMPRLVCSVAAAPLDLNNSCAFRYYPRAIDEVLILAKWMKDCGVKRVIPIQVNSAFGDKTREELDRQCAGNPVLLGITKLTGKETIEEITAFFTNQIAEHNASNAKTCFFLILYGESLTKTIKAINAIEVPLKILSVSTLTTELAAHNCFSKKHEWITCVPHLQNNEQFNDDVISYFVHASLRRYAKSIVCSKDRGKEFSEIWINNQELPPIEQVDWPNSGNGFDSKIAMIEKKIS